ncbi:MAG: tRNA (adenosine(37)-N6)-threonylcarbamoyltransferase complex dimerization subunit type 1 TsaB [Rhodospirillales bacterium]|nr:tRNA (adenosine(37)-N6)-threonylcarbamoyltransferase complex dimerization subunit type 1 TsaB [Rhodospirillales bacterium]
MKILALDTATNACSVALRFNGELKARLFEEMPRGQSEALVPMVLDCLEQGGTTFEELDALAVTIGPGAFTGLRIGLSTARALALAAKLPLIGVTSLEAVAHGISEDERKDHNILVVLDAKRSDVYCQIFDNQLSPTSEPQTFLPEELPGLTGDGPLLLVGDYAPRLGNIFPEAVLSQANGLPDAAIVAQLAEQKGLPKEVIQIDPLYIRPPDAKLPKNGGRLRP